MTPDETFIIILVIIGCVTVVSVVSKIFSRPERDIPARDRDRGLAKLFEARAQLMHTESLERRHALSIQANEERQRRREQVCADVRDARGSS